MTTNIALPAGLEFVPRKKWRAFLPERRTLLKVPVSQVRLTHTASKTCNDEHSCRRRVKRLQCHHMFYRDLADISFNFLVDPFGRIYEGRGWYLQAERTEKYQHLNNTCVDIAFIGKYKKDPPTLESVKAAEEFIQYGIQAGLIEPHYSLLGLKSMEDTSADLQPPRSDIEPG